MRLTKDGYMHYCQPKKRNTMSTETIKASVYKITIKDMEEGHLYEIGGLLSHLGFAVGNKMYVTIDDFQCDEWEEIISIQPQDLTVEIPVHRLWGVLEIMQSMIPRCWGLDEFIKKEV